MTESLMRVWEAMPQLKHVMLDDVDLRAPAAVGHSHIGIESLKHLQHLSAKHLALTKQGTVQLLADLPRSMTALLLDGTSFCDESSRCLANLSNLRHLSLAQRPDANGAVQPDVAHACGFSADAVCHAFRNLTALRTLDMHGCCMPHETTVALLKALPKSMKELDISKNHFPAGAAPLVATLGQLRRLCIGYKYETLSDEVALALAGHITSLCELSFFAAEWHPSAKLSADACRAMVRSLRALPHVNKSAAKYFDDSLHAWWPSVASGLACMAL